MALFPPNFFLPFPPLIFLFAVFFSFPPCQVLTLGHLLLDFQAKTGKIPHRPFPRKRSHWPAKGPKSRWNTSFWRPSPRPKVRQSFIYASRIACSLYPLCNKVESFLHQFSYSYSPSRFRALCGGVVLFFPQGICFIVWRRHRNRKYQRRPPATPRPPLLASMAATRGKVAPLSPAVAAPRPNPPGKRAPLLRYECCIMVEYSLILRHLIIYLFTSSGVKEQACE